MEDQSLSRRERQIMDIVYALGEASATAVLDNMADPPSRDSVRTMLRILQEKGHLKHHKQGREFIYSPVRPRDRAGRSALERVLNTFYDGSLEQALTARLTDPSAQVSEKELKRLSAIIRQARERGR